MDASLKHGTRWEGLLAGTFDDHDHAYLDAPNNAEVFLCPLVSTPSAMFVALRARKKATINETQAKLVDTTTMLFKQRLRSGAAYWQ